MLRACFDINEMSTLLLEGWEAALGMVLQQHPTSEKTQKTPWKHLEPPPVSQRVWISSDEIQHLLSQGSRYSLKKAIAKIQGANNNCTLTPVKLLVRAGAPRGQAGWLRWLPSEFLLNEQPPIASYNTNLHSSSSGMEVSFYMEKDSLINIHRTQESFTDSYEEFNT